MRRLAIILIILLITTISFSQRPKADIIPAKNGDITVQPILHATLVLQWNNKTIYVDPIGGAEAFEGIANPDIILITDIHGDHTDLNTLKALHTEKTIFVVPPAVAEMVKKDFEKQLNIIQNGGIAMIDDILINAIPAYNLPEEKDSFHPKGRGNGYFFEMGGKKIYISGDTEDIQEMRDLKGVDIAFVCMNLPYTMSVDQAADAVLEFKPKIVYPYHYRGNPEISDVTAFKKIVNSKNPKIEVRLRDWYAK